MKQVGTVREFSIGKGWGFIEAESGRKVFFHHSNILMGYRPLSAGDPVEFSMGRDGSGRLQAVNVRPF